MQRKYSIKELEHLSGIKAHTIRAWESRYELISPERTETNIRYYTDNDLKRLLNVAVLVQGGARISKVAEMTDEEMREAVVNSGNYESNFSSYVSALKAAMLDYDDHAFDAILSRCIIKYGAEKALLEIVGAFIKEVGLLWQVGAIRVSHEHFSSNLLRMKLFSLVDQAVRTKVNEDKSGYILYLPSNELHELSLLYLYYLLISKGHRVVYLGQDIPLTYLPEVSERTGITNFISIFTTSPHVAQVPEYLQQIGEVFPEKKCHFFFTGRQLDDSALKLQSAEVELFEGFSMLLGRLNSL